MLDLGKSAKYSILAGVYQGVMKMGYISVQEG
jgi:hypothetical protein